MRSFKNRKLVFFICTFAIFIVLYEIIVVRLSRSSTFLKNSVALLNLTNSILTHEAHLRNHPYWHEECEKKYGIQMIKDWKSTRIDLCTKHSNSKISCYTKDDLVIPRRLCLLINTKIQLYEPYYNNTMSDLSSESKVSISRDVVSADCEPEALNYPKIVGMQEHGFFIEVERLKLRGTPDLRCDHNVTHTVFWIWRWDTTNAYHFMEDIMNTFVSLVLLDQNPDNVEIAIYDGMKGNVNNPLFTLWSSLFTKGVRIIRSNPFPNNTCFSRSITNMYGIRSHFTEYGGYKKDTNCLSPILKTFQDWAIEKLLIEHNLIPVKKLTLLFISRQQYISTRKITRVIDNEALILKALKENYPTLNVVVFRPENFATFKEQVEVVVQGNIMIGAHGAGLVYSLFMSPGSHLIEIFMDDRSSMNRHFHNVASWVGLQYQSIEYYGNIVPPEDIIHVTDKAVKNLIKIQNVRM